MKSAVLKCSVLGALFAFAVGYAGESLSADLRIGSSAALSGPAALLGQRFHAGAKAWFDQVNQRGGVHGMKIVVDLRDDAYESSRAEANTRILAEDSRTLALFGYIGTPTSREALPFVHRLKIPFVGAYTGAAMLRDPFDVSVFNVRASYADEAGALARAMANAGVRKLAVLYQADGFGRAGLEAMRSAAGVAGIDIAALTSVKRNTSLDKAEVQAMIESAQSDAIFMVSSYGTCAAFVRQAREQGYSGRFYSLSFPGKEPLREALGGSLEGVTISQVVPDVQDRSLPVVASYQQAMRKSGDTHFDSISLEGFIAARVLVEGIRRATPPLTRESLRQSLDGLGTLDLGGFALTYSARRHLGSSHVELVSAK